MAIRSVSHTRGRTPRGKREATLRSGGPAPVAASRARFWSCNDPNSDGGGGGSRTFPQPLEPATYTFYKEYEVPKVPLCRGYRTPIVHGGLFERPPLMSKPGPNCKAKGEVVEAGRIELPSEETDDRERSCFSQVHLCLVSVA